MLKDRLLAYGDIAMDVIVKKSVATTSEEDECVEDLHISPGGSAANCAAVASSLGLPASFLGMLGDDDWSKMLVMDLKKHGVDTRQLLSVHGKLPVCISIVGLTGERKFYSYRGVNAVQSYPVIPDSIFSNFHYLHLSGYSFQTPDSCATAISLLRGAKHHGLKVSLDPSFLFARDTKLDDNKILPEVDYFFPSREEVYQLTKLRDPLKAACRIHEQGPKVVIVTLDKDGCLVVGDGFEEFIKVTNDEAVLDTTGAGDAFCGGFLFATAAGFAPGQACKVGSAAAAHIIARYGGREAPPRGEDILRILSINNETELVHALKKVFTRNLHRRK